MTAPVIVEYWRDWYEITTSTELRQGDIFRGMLAFWLPQNLPMLAADPMDGQPLDIATTFGRADWIILSASCDIVRRDDVHVLLARVAEASGENLRAKGAGDLKDKIEVLRQGYDPQRFLLADCPSTQPPFPMSFVDYRQQTFLPIVYVRAHCGGDRLRMKPPFREKLGAWAGACLGRVGIEDSSQIPRQSGSAASKILRTAENPPQP